MLEEKTDTIKLPPVEQIGFVVKDIDKAVEYYSSTFGWGPFQIFEHEMKGVIFRGEPSDCHLKIAFTHSGPIEIELIQVLEGDDAVSKNRELMGATNPAEAEAGTIRADFAETIDENAVHGSDSLENAAIEIDYFFSDIEVCPRTR